MKLFVVSDIHGSAYWAEKATEKFKKSGADMMVLLGDVYNHGPRNPFPQQYAPMKVAEILNAVADKLLVIRGNCDSEVDAMISNFDFLAENVLLNEGRRIFLTHGHIHNKNNVPHLQKGDVMLYGHFHICEIVDVNGATCVNVGSCALPKDGNNCYCIVDNCGVGIFDFDDNVIARHCFN